jgi:Domain of unknown function (DUF5666)
MEIHMKTKFLGWLLTACAFVAAVGVGLGSTGRVYANDLPDHRGVITSRPGGLLGVWVVGGRSFTATAATEFDTVEGPLTIGACAKVRYLPDNTADEIDSEPADDCSGSATPVTPNPTAGTPAPTGTPRPPLQIFRGLLDSRPGDKAGTWVIGGRAFVANAATELDTLEGPLNAGVCVKVRFFVNAGVMIADEIDSEPAGDCGVGPTPSVTPTPVGTSGPTVGELRGRISSRPDGLLGIWVVAGRSFTATNATEFDTEEGPLNVGACVKVEFTAGNIAREIDSEPNSDCAGQSIPPSSTPAPGREDSKVFARIEAFPAAPYIGLWRIGGVDYQANSRTEFEQKDGTFAIGACVKAEFRVENRVNLLEEIETEDGYKCQAEGGASAPVQFKAYGVLETYTTTLPAVWSISGISYTVPAATVIDAEHGPFAVGVFVEVKYVLNAGQRVAVRKETHRAPGSGEDRIGRLEVRPSDDWGTWRIDGVDYVGDPAIRVHVSDDSPGRRSAAAVDAGQTVWVNYYVVNGVRYATWVMEVRQSYLPILAR